MAGGVIKVTPSPGSFLVQDLVSSEACQDMPPDNPRAVSSTGKIVRGVVAIVLGGAALSAVAGSALGQQTWAALRLAQPSTGLRSACAAYRQNKYEHNQRNPLLSASVERLDHQAYQIWLLQGDRLNQELLQATGLRVLDVVTPAAAQGGSSSRLIRAAAQCLAVGIDFGAVRTLREFPRGPERLG